MSANPKKSRTRLTTEAAAAADAGRFDDAVRALEQVLEQQPNDATAAYHLGDVCARRRDYASALRYYRKAADAFELDDQPEKAIAVWRKIIRRRPDLIDVHVWLADLLVRLGRTQDARIVYQKLVNALVKYDQPELAGLMTDKLARLERETR